MKKKISEMDVQQRADHLRYLMRRVSDLHVQYALIAREPHVVIEPPFNPSDRMPQTVYQTPRNEVLLAGNVRLTTLAAESMMLLEELHDFLKTVNDNNSETIQTVRQSFLSILQREGVKSG
jgi:hypothetical protein